MSLGRAQARASNLQAYNRKIIAARFRINETQARDPAEPGPYLAIGKVSFRARARELKPGPAPPRNEIQKFELGNGNFPSILIANFYCPGVWTDSQPTLSELKDLGLSPALDLMVSIVPF